MGPPCSHAVAREGSRNASMQRTSPVELDRPLCGLLPDKKLENECRAAALPPRAATCSGPFLQSTVTYIPYLYNANLTPTNMATSFYRSDPSAQSGRFNLSQQ